jgi:hypothetical protein
MIRRFKRYRAVGAYFWRLSGELSRRFGRKHYYNMAEVSKAAHDGNFDVGFIAYAHAMFCSRCDFDAHYTRHHVDCSYDGLREVVARRFFDGATGFDAWNILLRADTPKDREYAFSQNAPID